MGSSSYISNLDGEVVQHVEYVPFGEVFLEEKNAVWNTPYLFNGKELDKETGMSYYGARYYEAKTSVWISVDKPLYDGTYFSGEHNGGVYNSQNLNGYGYCYNNPIRFIDPDGNQVDITINDKSRVITLTQHLVFYGSQSSSGLSAQISSNVTDQFNRENLTYVLNGSKYNVNLKTTYETLSVEDAFEKAKSNTDNKVQFIRVSDNKRSSFHNIGENSGFYSTNDDLTNSTTPSHEGAHGFGLVHTDGFDGDNNSPPNIIRPRGGALVLSKWSINGVSKKGIDPNFRTWDNNLLKKVLDNATWNKDGKTGSTGKATNRTYNHNGTERGFWDKLKDFLN